jgi:phosphopantothenate-cysteine ligase
MKKNIIITSGPTNERLDAVMKITNMSTGALGAIVAEEFLQEEEKINKLYYLSPKLARKPRVESDKLELITIESAEDLLRELKKLLLEKKIDAVVHSAAVGDYIGEYAITARMLASEITEKTYSSTLTKEELEKYILDIIRNPENVVSDEHKISSYEKDLMFKLSLTPKVIGSIKKESPETQLFGFKLLDGVSHEELIEVATRLREKNQADYIIANDLSTIGNGTHPAYFVGKNGVEYTCETKQDIAKTLKKVIFK